jgi:hypothetical protein
MIGVGKENNWIMRDTGHRIMFLISRADAELVLAAIPAAEYLKTAAQAFAANVIHLPRAA